jgi:hypothetical protein
VPVTAWFLTFSNFQNTPQVDTRDSSVNNVGREQQYHFNFTWCPHARSNAAHRRVKTSVRGLPRLFVYFTCWHWSQDIGPEPDRLSNLELRPKYCPSTKYAITRVEWILQPPLRDLHRPSFFLCRLRYGFRL